MKLVTIALCFITSSAWADIRCSDYLINHEQLLPATARILAKKAPNENRKEVNISVLHIVLEDQCNQTPERPLAGVLAWFNGILRDIYDQNDGHWIVFTENGEISNDLGKWIFMI